jgi:hypothetical protein
MTQKPSPLRATVILWAFRVLAATLASYPAARVVSRAGLSGFPDGDRLLFSPGGEMLLEVLRLDGRAVGAAVEGASFAGLLLSLVGLLPLGMVITALATPRATTSDLVRRAASAFSTLLVLDGALMLSEGILATLVAASAAAAAAFAGAFNDERIADVARLAVIALGVVAALWFGLVQDLARVYVVRDGTPLLRAVRAGLAVLARRGSDVIRRWLSLTGVAGALIFGAAYLTSALDVSRPGAARLAAVFAVHQAVVLGLSALRVSFLSAAVDFAEAEPFVLEPAPLTDLT